VHVVPAGDAAIDALQITPTRAPVSRDATCDALAGAALDAPEFLEVDPTGGSETPT
jgi:hypothetical protein